MMESALRHISMSWPTDTLFQSTPGILMECGLQKFLQGLLASEWDTDFSDHSDIDVNGIKTGQNILTGRKVEK